MNLSKIVFLDDLLREEFINSRAFIYQAIREPIRQALGFDLPNARGFPAERGLGSGFCEGEFRRLCRNKSWVESYFFIPDQAVNYLMGHIDEGAFIIGYEMPPWLVRMLEENGRAWLNIRLSPVRFGRDLYVVLQSSFFDVRELLKDYHVTDQELFLEAGLMRASVVHNDLYRKDKDKGLSDGVLFIGQTRSDASLISDAGELLRIERFSEKIKESVGARNIIYKPHPFDKSWARKEKTILQEITGKEIKKTSQDTYSLLAGNMGFDVMSISSGVLQEAHFFERKSVYLHKPICDFRSGDSCHIRFMDFVSPALWAKIFSEDCTVEFPVVPGNMMRVLHNAWWGYSDYMFSNNDVFSEAFLFGVKSKIRKPFGFLRSFLFKG